MAIAVPWPIKKAKENVFCIQNFKQDCYIYTNIISLNYTEETQYNRILHIKVLSYLAIKLIPMAGIEFSTNKN